ncbi:RNA-binding transcriptional accessory protein [Leucobacter viscericola]|uniref:RNA-binding transcriptional accessory protein n=1 Tax=Leucobacter viscericola TaxID=2714935 RepID=A0A6G7XHB2_9MICO|nr:RNA-binding transcriptional accessory protein [Leucobacter viscericola]
MTSETRTTAAPTAPSIEHQIATELGVRHEQVQATIALLDGGSTVPFIARYRKEATGGLDDIQLRTLEERLRYLRELAERRITILEAIREQGKLTPELTAQINLAESKARLEDIYLPYKTKRRTRAQIAREAGLEPLADALLSDPTLEPAVAAQQYVDAEKEVPDTTSALDGARNILTERFGEDADLIGRLRDKLWAEGRMVSAVKKGAAEKGAKFADYFEFSEAISKMPSHRILALFRGASEEVLTLSVDPEPSDAAESSASGRVISPYEMAIATTFGISDQGRAADAWLLEAVRVSWRGRILVRLELDVRSKLREQAEEAAITVFASNLRDLLLAAPAGERTTLGLDPGLRTGTKVAVVDATGKVLAHDTIYPHAPHNKWQESLVKLDALVTAHNVELVAIGNGTASRETDALAAELVALVARDPARKLTKVMVSEAGASVYSASAFASQELPGLDVSIRGAVSIARRLQDPLAELVKIDPKSIGVGQYQHDLPDIALSRALDAVVEDCVNGVGVDLNTASAPLLTRVSGIGSGLAESIVLHRDLNGPFDSRAALKKVPRLGPKAFELCAGFLRIRGGKNPLDASGVHPESYALVDQLAKSTASDVPGLIGNTQVLSRVRPAEFVSESFGLPTITDVLAELEKPGRDPRPSFATATFAAGVNTVSDLRPGMILEGVVTNVAAFGAFVDVGVHQDGLIHISALSDRFISNPRDVVKPGDVVRAKVLEVDVPRKRISLTLRLTDEVPSGGARNGGGAAGGRPQGSQRSQGAKGRQQGQKSDQRPAARKPAPTNTAMADALRAAGLG